MSSLAAHYLRIQGEIAAALERASRTPGSARILAVSKGQSPQALAELIALGQGSFGENYAQEWREKREALPATGIQWHFIGRLQSNKLKYLLGQIALFHSLDRWELALRMDEMSGKKGLLTPVLVEVDLAGEASKTGVSEKELPFFLQRLNGLEHLDIQGLMAFPPPTEDPENSRPYFRRLREILFEFNRKNVYKKPLTELSMGMSNDYEVAAEEGATWLRIGRAIFADAIR